MRNMEPFYFAPQPKPFGGWIAFKDSPSPPPAPDYTGAARATSAGTVQASLANNLMARPNINTPLGSQTWRQIGTQTIPGAEGNAPVDVPMYEQNINMTPEGQDLYNRQMNLSKGLMGIGQTSLDQVTNSLGQPQDLGSVQDIADQSYAMQTQRLDPQWQQREDMERTRLANQGLAPGGEAYTNAMRDMNAAKNDAYTQARLSSISTMPQTYQLSTAQRMQPLTELNAIRSGAQPQMPQFQPTSYFGGAQGPNMLGAANAQYQGAMNGYNAQVGQDNAMMSGLFGLGSSLAGPMMFGAMSDRRLKRDVKQIGTDRRGFGLYEFRYLWSPELMLGVMADEVEKIVPKAVKLVNGFKAVNYGMLYPEAA